MLACVISQRQSQLTGSLAGTNEFQQVCIISKASVNKQPFPLVLPFYINLCGQKLVCTNRSKVLTMPVSFEYNCMQQNNTDPYPSEMYLEGKDRNVTTKTWDRTARSF